jgi:hypothetical protein
MIEAKPIVDKKYWILKQDNRKVGVVEAQGDGYTVRINDQVGRFKTIPMVRKKVTLSLHHLKKPQSLHQTKCMDLKQDAEHSIPCGTSNTGCRCSQKKTNQSHGMPQVGML